MSSLRTTPVPLNVGSNTSVLRGIGNFENASRGTPEIVYSVYDSPASSIDVVEERAEFGGRQLGGGVGHRLHDLVAIEIGRDDRADVVERFGDGGVLLQQPHPLRFRLLERRDIARDLRGADDRAGVVADRRDGQRDVERPAVLGDPHGLEMLDALAAAQPREDVVFFGLPLGRDQHPDRPADELVGRIAEQPLGGGVARLNDAVEILREDRIVGRVDDRGEVRGTRARDSRRSGASCSCERAREQFARAERLDEILVGAGLQPFDARFFARRAPTAESPASTGSARRRGSPRAGRTRRASAS